MKTPHFYFSECHFAVHLRGLSTVEFPQALPQPSEILGHHMKGRQRGECQASVLEVKGSRLNLSPYRLWTQPADDDTCYRDAFPAGQARLSRQLRSAL
ncbi:unnamed protein product [Lota lota]